MYKLMYQNFKCNKLLKNLIGQNNQNLRIVGSETTTITYVFGVNISMNAAKLVFLTSILENWAASLLNNKLEI